MSNSHILFLHGFLGNTTFWQPLEALICDAIPNLRTTVLPLPGHGDSDFFDTHAKPSPSFSDAAAWAASHLDSHASNWLVGYSMGARLALQTLLDFPDACFGAVLFSVHPGISNAVERTQRLEWEQDLTNRLSGGLTPLVDYFESLPIFETQKTLSGSTLQAQRRMRLAHSPTAVKRSIELLGLGNTPDMTPRLAEVSRPLLLVTGALDEKYTRMAKALTNRYEPVQHTIIDGCGHNTVLESPRRSAQALIKWIENK